MPLSAKGTTRYYSFLFTDQELKIAKLDKEGKKLKAFWELPLPSGIIVDGEVNDADKLAKFLSEIKTKAQIKESFVAIALPEAKASTHTLILPPIETSEIDQAIKLQAESFLPFSYQNEYLDWMLIEKTAEGKNKILVSAILKKVVDGFIEAFEKASFEPVAFETTSLSLFRLLPPEGKKLSFAAEISDTSVVLILGSESNIEACSVIQEIDQFVETIRKMNEFYLKEELKEKPKIYLCGKGLSEKIIDDLKKELSLEPVILNTNVTNIPKGKENELAILISLSQKEIAPPEDIKTINILPSSLAKKYRLSSRRRKTDKLSRLIILIVILFNLATAFSFFKIKESRSQLSKLVDDSYPTINAETEELIGWQKKAAIVNQTSEQGGFLVKIIKELLKSPSENIEILDFNFDQTSREIILTGRAKKREDLLEFKKEMETKDFVAKVTVPFSSLEKETKAEFRMKLMVK